jgi:predicted Zn-dependent protease
MGVGLTGLVGLMLGACVAEQTGASLAPAAVRVPAEAPRVTGRERATDADHLKLVASFGGEAKAPAVTRLLTEITDRLVHASDRPDQAYAVTLLDSPVINAFALPNGRL